MGTSRGKHTLASEPSRRPGVTDGRSPLPNVLLVLVIVVCLAGAGMGGVYLYHALSAPQHVQEQEEQPPATRQEVSAVLEAGEGLVDAPINFEGLVAEADNTDLYAWLYVPGTTVSYPVCQSPTNDEFYQDHDETGAATEGGAVYSEASANARDFQDPVTVLYGNNCDDGSMFASLHNFEDAQFFSDHPTMRVYVPGHVYTYEIISAFTTDDTHIMYRYYYFTEKSKHKEFLRLVKNPTGISVNRRPVEGVTTKSKILVLSTHNEGALSEHGRYLVCGVMTDDQQTG